MRAMEPIGESLDNDLDPDFGPDFDFDQGRSCCTAATRRICTDVGFLKEL
jgi:hypothetical protein